MNTFRYFLKDAKEGILRNKQAAIATILLVFISLTFITGVLIIQNSLQDALSYVQSQVKIKVFVKDDVSVEDVENDILMIKEVQTTTVETSEQLIERMRDLFQDKPHLFSIFDENDFPNTVLVTLKDPGDSFYVADKLHSVDGVKDVVYAQKFATLIQSWSETFQTYGLIALFLFVIACLFTVMIAIHLALHQRKSDIRVKLLLGAKEAHVRVQFVIEGAILGCIGSLLSCFCLFFIYKFAFVKLVTRYSFVLDFQPSTFFMYVCWTVLSGIGIGVIGSLLSTRSFFRQ